MDTKIYGQLLTEAMPTVITNEQEHKRISDLFADLFKKELSPEEEKLFDLLADILESYDRKEMPIIERESPLATLKYLIAENNLKQVDLVDVFGTQSIVSEVLASKREINKQQAKKLAKRFKMSVVAFI